MNSRKRSNDQNGEEGSRGELSKVDTRYYDELFVKIRESDEFKDEESFDILCNNIVDQIAEDEKELKKCLYSIHIDFFVFKLSPDHFIRLLESMTGGSGDDADTKLGGYLNDAKMSRAYDACLLLCSHKINKSTKEKIQAFVDRLCDYFLSHIEALLEAQSPATGLFVLRSLVRVLGQSDLLDDQLNKSNSSGKRGRNEFGVKDIELKLLPTDWSSCKFIKKLAKKIKAINVLEKALVANISPLIGLVLRKMQSTYPDDASELFDSIHKQFVKKPNSFHSMVQDAVGSRFIESYLLCLPVDLLVDHYLENHIMPNLVAYVNHIYANYPLQTLLRHRVPVEPKLSSLFDSLIENLQSIINLHTDLSYKNYFIVELIAACQKSESLDRAKLINTLVEYFGCNTDESRPHFLKALLVYEKVEDINKECGLDQALFMFEIRPIATTIASKLIELDDKIITKSFNAFNSNDLEHLCTNNSGSHFIQHSLRTFHAKDRTVWLQGFMDKLKGRYAILCSNKSGSFVVETIWSVSNLKQRLAIADELKSTENQLRNDRFGRFFVNKIGLSFYKRKPEEWKQLQTNEFKKKKMLEELLEDDSKSNQNDSNKKKKLK